MKFNNIFKTQFLLLACAMLVFSCTQDPVVEKAEDELFNVGGAIVNVSNVQNGFFNLGELESTFVAFDVAGAGETINAITVFKSLNGGAKVEHAVINTIPSTVNVSLVDAISGLGITLDDVKVGDNFNFTFESTTSTGTYITGNSLSVDTSCPSNLAGEYTATTTGTSTDGCCPDVTTVNGTVNITGENGSYIIEDFSAGLYFTWYATYGITELNQTDGALNGAVKDVCGMLSGTFGEPFSTDVIVTGSIDQNTGVITYTWTNGYDDTADVTLTPN